MLEELLERTAGRGLGWTVYGGGDRDILLRLRRRPEVRVRGYYRAGALPMTLRRDRVDLALLPSIWPESYALTLDECRLAGVPVLAFDHGAIAERLRRSSAGVAVEADGLSEAMLEALDRIVDQGFGAAQPRAA
ncbi:MAG: glycosyltransferase family 4 protein, partial [Gammaproteobacteria bacterium]|nr:glycosyltransferase family 4 protein [Gammaproteobacteria bacterium]